MWNPRKTFKETELLLDERVEIIASCGSDSHAATMLLIRITSIGPQLFNFHAATV